MKVRFGAPFAGMDTSSEPSTLAPNLARSALNLDIDRGTLKVRRGYTKRYTFGGPVTGLHDYKKHNGTLIQLIMANGSLYSVSSWAPTLIDSGYSTTRSMSLAVVNDRAYFCEGTSFRVTDGTDVYDAPLPRPDARTPSVADGGVGNLTGTYDYKYTYYSSTWGQESAASNATARIEAIDSKVDVSNWDIDILPAGAAPDARIDKVRLYRRRVDAGEIEWRLQGEYDIGAGGDITAISDTVTDDKIDEDISILFAAPPSFTGSIPDMDYMTYQNGVLYCVRRNQPTRVYYTIPGQPWVLANYFTLEGSDGDTEAITGIEAFQSVVVIFKENSTWILSGNSTATHSAVKVNAQIGCRSNGSIVPVGNRIFFQTEEGYAYFDGANVQVISDPIRDDAVARSYAADSFALGIHDHDRDAILWPYTPGAGTNQDLLVHFYSNTMRSGVPSWVRWKFPSAVRAIGYTTDATTKKRSVTIGLFNGEVGTLDAGVYDDGGLSIDWHWETGKLDLGYPDTLKIWSELAVEVSRGGDGSVILASLAKDLDDVHSFEIFPQSGAVSRARISRWSRDMTLRLSGSQSGSELEIVAFTVEADPGGRA